MKIKDLEKASSLIRERKRAQEQQELFIKFSKDFNKKDQLRSCNVLINIEMTMCLVDFCERRVRDIEKQIEDL